MVHVPLHALPQPPLPSTFTHDHLTGLREVNYDAKLENLVANGGDAPAASFALRSSVV